ALADAQIDLVRVSNKASHDYAEVFDGVPSQHDGKDAAVIAELAALGKAQPWAYQPASPWEQELTYWVEWMVAHRQILTTWQGRLEGLLACHWREATEVLKLSSGTLLRVLKQYGDPKALAADSEAAQRLARWGRAFLSPEKIEHLLAGARSSVGVRVGEWERRQLGDYAEQALASRREVARAGRRVGPLAGGHGGLPDPGEGGGGPAGGVLWGEAGARQLRHLAVGHAVLQAQGKVVGVPTACVLWTSTGDPRKYHAAAAYRKAMGLNLVERSSGTSQGRLRISKRGSARARHWLYFAALRLVQRCGVRPWYEAKKARDADDARRVLVAVMRKLALALYQVAVHDEEFQPRRLFCRIGRGCSRSKPPPSGAPSPRQGHEGGAPAAP